MLTDIQRPPIMVSSVPKRVLAAGVRGITDFWPDDDADTGVE